MFTDRLIGKMVAEIEDLGCAIPKDFFVCAPAPDKVCYRCHIYISSGFYWRFRMLVEGLSCLQIVSKMDALASSQS